MRHSIVGFAFIFFGGIAAYWICWTSVRTTDQFAMIGTWTDEAGPTGNSIRFYYVRREIPGAPLAEAWEGHLAVNNFLGQTDAVGTWNYGYWEPLVLNLTINGRPWFAVVRSLDADHLQVRFGTNAEEIYGSETFDHPDTHVLKRTGWETGSD